MELSWAACNNKHSLFKQCTSLVVGVGKYKHITLHWLPVPPWILFKIAMSISAFDCVREHCHAYFNVCIPVAGISGRANLRSAECHDMLVPSPRTQLGRWSFHVAAPTVWNALPPQLHSSSISRGQFRAGLKTHLFTQAYTDSQTPLRTFVEKCIILHLHFTSYFSMLRFNLGKFSAS